MTPDGVESEALAEVSAMVGEFRRSLVLVPLLDDGWLSAEQAGLRWMYAFAQRLPHPVGTVRDLIAGALGMSGNGEAQA